MFKISKEEAVQLTDPTPAESFSQSTGRTFWDWATGRHPLILKILIAILAGVILWYLFSISSEIAFAVLGSAAAALIVGFFMFHNAFFWQDSVVLVAFDQSDMTVLNIYVIGKEKFRKLQHSGIVQSFTSSSGDSIYVADSFDGQIIHYPWSFETSRIKFVLQAETFDDVKQRAEEALRENFLLHNVPVILGIDKAKEYTRKYDEVISRILRGEDAAASSTIREYQNSAAAEETPEADQ